MAVWIKVVAVLLGLSGFAAVVAVYGLPHKPAPQAVAVAPAPAPATPAAPAEPPKAPETQAQAPEPAPAPAQVAKATPEELPKAAPQPEAPPAIDPPTFDVVRVTPTGDLVVAGRASAGSQVELLRNGDLHDKVKADPAGQFAMVPPSLPPGAHDLSLMMVLPDGRREPSRQTVAVSVPSDVTGEVVVALAAPDKPTQILSQAPAATAPAAKPAAAAATPGERTKAAIETVEVEESGRFFVSGRSAPAAAVRLYLNDTFLAPAIASPEGRWSFAINRGFEPGAYRIRIDDVDAKGTVISRAEVPFDYAPRVAGRQPSGKGAQVATAANGSVAVRTSQPAGAQVASTQPTAPGSDVVVDEIRTTTVTRGDSLWRISKRIYGKGQRFTVIYEANAKQIRDPRLIYPGQLFVVPGEKTN
ncbi:MAG: LysM peptidoglycan-binding domain-containing protein [Alsobacter sp.]